MIWAPLTDSDVVELLGPGVSGPRRHGERSDCEMLVVCAYEHPHPLISTLWEVWARSGAGWIPCSSWRSRELARAEAQRLRTLWLARNTEGRA